jgi:hypothetical protein
MKEIKGGKFADVLITYDFARTINLEFQDALLSSESMKNLWGAKITTAAEGFTIHQRELVTAVDGDLVLEYPVALDDEDEAIMIAVYDKDGQLVTEDVTAVVENTLEGAFDGEYTVFYKALVENAGGEEGEWKAIQALITSETFPKTVTFVGKTFFINQKNGKKVEAEVEVPKLKLMANFNVGLEAEGDASVFDFSGMALIDGKDKELLKVKTIRYID